MAPRSSYNGNDSDLSGSTIPMDENIDEDVRTILELEDFGGIDTENLVLDYLDRKMLTLICYPKKTIRQLLAAVEAKDTYNLTRLRFILMSSRKTNNYKTETTEDVAIHVILKLFYKKLFENYFPEYQRECNLAMYYAFRVLRSINANRILNGNISPNISTYFLESYYMKLMNCQHVKLWSFDDLCRETVSLYPNYFK